MISSIDVPTAEYAAVYLSTECPICQLRHERETRFITNVLNDWVQAATVRAMFIDSLGYCPRHAWLQQAIEWNYEHDGFTTADMYRYVLLWNLDGLEMFTWLSRYLLKFQRMFPFARLNHHNGGDKPDRLQQAFNSRVHLPAGLLVKGQCPICEAGEQAERARLRSLLEPLTSPEFQAECRVPDGLCLTHFKETLAGVKDPRRRQLLIVNELDRLALLAEQLTRTGERQGQLCLQAITWLVGNRSAASRAPIAHMPQSFDEALTLDACPLCTLTVASRQDDLKEQLTSQTIEVPLCHRHAWQLYDLAIAQSGESELAAVVCEWMNATIAQLRADEASRPANSDRPDGRWHGWIKRRVPREQIKLDDQAEAWPDCPMCRSEVVIQEKLLAHFVKQLGDAELRQRYAASRGLCLPHLRAALQTSVHHEDRLFLAVTARDRVANLIRLIEEYERKHIWNYRDEPKLAAEQSSWIRAVAFEVGEPIWAWKISPIQ
jgi:hypothetical protein